MNEILVSLTSDIVAAYVSNNTVSAQEVPGLVSSIFGALSGLGSPPAEVEVERKPVVSLKASVKPDHIVCLECGAKLKMLKRHLTTHHALTIGEYRVRWSLPASYPTVAPDYSEKRTMLAKQSGLGRKIERRPSNVKNVKVR